MRSGVASSRSSVRPTAPSVEFSTGTTVNCASALSQRRNASSTEATGSACTADPKCLRTACSLKVPSGPRYDTRIACSRPRQAEMISRKIAAILSADSVLESDATLRRIAVSRSGRYAGAPPFSSPMRFASAARSSSSFASRSSRRSISPRILSRSVIHRQVAYREYAIEVAELLHHLCRHGAVGVHERVRHLAPGLVQHVVDVDLALAE